jgi:hypothetical protein
MNPRVCDARVIGVQFLLSEHLRKDRMRSLSHARRVAAPLDYPLSAGVPAGHVLVLNDQLYRKQCATLDLFHLPIRGLHQTAGAREAARLMSATF